jgi:hypothetical protein
MKYMLDFWRKWLHGLMPSMTLRLTFTAGALGQDKNIRACILGPPPWVFVFFLFWTVNQIGASDPQSVAVIISRF